MYLNGEPERLGWRQRGGRNRNLRIYSRLSVFIFHFRRDFGNNLTQQVSSLAKRSSSGGGVARQPLSEAKRLPHWGEMRHSRLGKHGRKHSSADGVATFSRNSGVNENIGAWLGARQEKHVSVSHPVTLLGQTRLGSLPAQRAFRNSRLQILPCCSNAPPPRATARRSRRRGCAARPWSWSHLREGGKGANTSAEPEEA